MPFWSAGLGLTARAGADVVEVSAVVEGVLVMTVVWPAGVCSSSTMTVRLVEAEVEVEVGCDMHSISPLVLPRSSTNGPSSC